VTRHRTVARIVFVTIKLTRTHALLFAVLFATQTFGLWVTLTRSALPHHIWWLFFSMVPGSAFLTTIVVLEMVRAVFSKTR
jgi:hypothetical protein